MNINTNAFLAIPNQKIWKPKILNKCLLTLAVVSWGFFYSESARSIVCFGIKKSEQIFLFDPKVNNNNNNKLNLKKRNKIFS